MDNACRDPCRELNPCDKPQVCVVVARDKTAMMVCKCPHNMVVSKDEICAELEVPIGVGCKADLECPSNRACLNARCVSPCACGDNAECTIMDHRPVCTCLEGYQGNPNFGCFKVGCSANEQCQTDKMCYSGVCIDPCYVHDPCDINAECYAQDHDAHCRCPSGMIGNPPEKCRVAGCRDNSECLSDKACHNRKCVDPCDYDDPCASNARCYVFEHTTGCRCEDAMPYGDPRISCHNMTVDAEIVPHCSVDADCPSQFACIRNYCRNPCYEVEPCDETAICKVLDSLPLRTMICECPEGFVIRKDGSCVVVDIQLPRGCDTNSQCPTLEMCINRHCKDPCECGDNADCQVIDHRAVCTCIPGFQGNPDAGCAPIGCTVDPDCADDEACYEGVCANPCLVKNPCASNAECYAESHKAYCRCPSGLIGDGYVQCLVIGCTSNSECPSVHGCVNNQCIDPCLRNDPCGRSAECVQKDHTAQCRCPEGMFGDPYIGCDDIIQPVCVNDYDCRNRLACIEEKCQNPCEYFEPCHPSSNCRVIDLKASRGMVCECEEGEVTKKDGKCELVSVIRPICEADDSCPEKEACINGFCKDACQCGANAECDVIEHHPVCTCRPGYEGDPEVRCLSIGCASNSECASTHACVNTKCVPVCGANNEPCGDEAECIGIDHEYSCICPPGSRGNPQTHCTAIGCTSDDACPNDRSCINQQCISPCTYDPCQDPAECTVFGHETACPCPPGFNRTMENGCEKLLLGCRSDPDCPSRTACVNRECIDPCSLDPCGINAECRIVDILPVRMMACECIPGYQGDASVRCDPVAVCPIEKGFVMNEDGECDCPPERGFYVNENGNCLLCQPELGFVLTEDGLCICDPEKGYVMTVGGYCDCPLPMSKDKDDICVLVTDPPIAIGCTRNSECRTDLLCDKAACVPPCAFEPCAKYSVCINANHTAVCVCITGYSGDAYTPDGCIPEISTTDFPRPDIEVKCLARGVQVDLDLADTGFNGLMYVKGYSHNPACRLAIKPPRNVGDVDFNVDFNTCGLVHENGLARFVLVLQKHPKLVTYKAQAYHIKCSYDTGEKALNIGFNVSMLTTAGTIANTGPPPTCEMKITDQFGGDITRADIGDLLQLRILVQPASIYGGFARSCVALTSGEEEDMDHTVTDDRGCSADPQIFEDWTLDSEKELVANFNAFKFPSSNSIRFQCNVRVCFGKCPPVNCDGFDAFGRRRRRRQAVDPDAELFYEDESTLDSQLREIDVFSQYIFTTESRFGKLTAPQEQSLPPPEVCVSKWGFVIALVITALLALVAVAVAVSCWLMAYRSRPRQSGPLPHPTEFPNPLFAAPQPLREPSPDYMS